MALQLYSSVSCKIVNICVFSISEGLLRYLSKFGFGAICSQTFDTKCHKINKWGNKESPSECSFLSEIKTASKRSGTHDVRFYVNQVGKNAAKLLLFRLNLEHEFSQMHIPIISIPVH